MTGTIVFIVRGLRSVGAGSLSLSALALCLFAAISAAEEFEMTDLYGETQAVAVNSINADGMVAATVNEQQIQFALRELRSIRRVGSTSNPTKGSQGVEVLLVGDGRIVCDKIRMDEEFFVLSGHGLFDGPLSVPIDHIRAILFDSGGLAAEARKTLRIPREEDRFFVRIDDSLEALDGLVEGLTDSEVSFAWQDQSRTLRRDDVLAIAIADAGAKPIGGAVVRFLDGQILQGSLSGVADGDLELELFANVVHKMPWPKVASIDIRSERLTYLSDLEPVVAEHKPIVTNERRWKKDKNVNGEPLRLGELTYAKGIGVASLSYLKFQLEEEYSTFCATIGVDASTEGRGDCVFLLRGDGKELARESSTGTDVAKKLRVDIGTVRELELIVLPGNDLDLSDHANWCDACLLK